MATATVKRKKAPSLTRIKAILAGAAFDPREDGPNAIITDTAIHNPRFAEDRAIEMIREGLLALQHPPEDQPVLGYERYIESVDRAIGLLALARAVREG